MRRQVQDDLVRGIVKVHRDRVDSASYRIAGFEFSIDPGVFDPFVAPSGSAMFHIAASVDTTGLRVLDMGCGSGIPTALLASRCEEIIGVDVSSRAVACARRNTQTLPNACIVRGDLFQAVSGRFDLVVANLPFLPAGGQDRRFFDSGFRTVRSFLRTVPEYLNPGGRVLLVWSDLETLPLDGPGAGLHYCASRLVAAQPFDIRVIELGPACEPKFVHRSSEVGDPARRLSRPDLPRGPV